MVSDMTPDGELAKKYYAGKTKTTQIIQGKENTVFSCEVTKCMQCLFKEII